MNVLGLSSYPVEAAATRYRLTQFVAPLAARGVQLTIQPFLDSDNFKRFYGKGGLLKKMSGLLPALVSRLSETLRLGGYDALFVQREAAFLGPAVFENLYRKLGGLPLVLDLDDATYIRYVSPTYGKAGSLLKFFGKTDSLIRQAKVVTCGNRFIAEYVADKGTPTVIVPTVVDTDIFHPLATENTPPVIGWIGTHSTFPLLESIFPVLQHLAQRHDFILKIVGAGRDEVRLDGVKIENLAWDLARETDDFRRLDIGLYPITTLANAPDEWLLGKSGFKAIQYMAVGVPFVMTPIGVCAEMGVAGETHFNARTADEWHAALDKLLTDKTLRRTMGAAGRRHALAHYTVPQQAEILEQTFRCLV